MLSKKLPVLLVALLLKAASSAAQGPAAPPPPPPSPDYQEVSVPVPRGVSLVTDVVRVLFSHDDEGRDKVQALIARRRARSEKRDQNLNISVPRNKLTRTLGLVD
jgi:predicted secreted protein